VPRLDDKLGPQVEKVFHDVKGEMVFETKSSLSRWKFVFKLALAPVSLTLSIAAIVLCVASKPFWVFLASGVVVDGIALSYTILNHEISKYTFKPLEVVANKILEIQECCFLALLAKHNKSRHF
jgi:hypothetical protein